MMSDSVKPAKELFGLEVDLARVDGGYSFEINRPQVFGNTYKSQAEALKIGRNFGLKVRFPINDCGPHQIPSIVNIVRSASDYYRVSIAKIYSRDRHARIAFVRQVIMWMCRRLTNLTLEEIGRIFGRDHGTVIFACKAVNNLEDTEPEKWFEILELETRINDAHQRCNRAAIEQPTAVQAV